MEGMREDGVEGWGVDATEQQLLSITSAPSGVISKQTDWNQPTEASPRESEGWTEEEWNRRVG